MMTVGDVMTRSVVSVRSWTPLKEVAQLLIERRISGVPVVDDDGVLLGVVSEGDFLMKEQGAQAIRHRPLARIFGESQRIPIEAGQARGGDGRRGDDRAGRHDRIRSPHR